MDAGVGAPFYSSKCMGGQQVRPLFMHGILRRQFGRETAAEGSMGFYEKYIMTVTKNDARTRNSVDGRPITWQYQG